jgi:hypothetical protein
MNRESDNSLAKHPVLSFFSTIARRSTIDLKTFLTCFSLANRQFNIMTAS